MILYDYWRSSASYRVRIALHAKGIAFEQRPVHLANGEQHSADYKALNPQGMVPLMVDGDVVISQSIAMMEYLEETHPEIPLLPSDAAGRATVRAMAQLVACDIHPLNNLRVLNYLEQNFGAGQNEKVTWMAEWVQAGFSALETQVSDTGFCYGDRLTIADCCLMPQIYNARRFNISMAEYPALRAIESHVLAQSAVKLAHPDVQPGAVK